MSLFRKPSQIEACNTCNVKADTGAIGIQVVPSPNQISENQSKQALKLQSQLATEMQGKYFSGMDLKSCDTHMKTCDHQQCSEATYNNKQSLHPATAVLKNANLTLRVNHLAHGVDSQAVCAEVTADHVDEMLETGEVSVAGNGGGFTLQSADNHSITSIKYYSSID